MENDKERWEIAGVPEAVWRVKWLFLVLFTVTGVLLFVADTELRAIVGLLSFIFLGGVVFTLLLSKLDPRAVCPCGRLVSLEDRGCRKCGRLRPPELGS